jgi:hypothetical protein
LREVLQAKSGWSVAAGVVVCNVVALAIATFTERRHKELGAYIWRLVGPRRSL